MKHLLATAVTGGLLSLGAAGAAQAAPVITPAPSVSSGDVTLVAQGCGPGGFRNHWGHCIYPRHYYRPPPPPFRGPPPPPFRGPPPPPGPVGPPPGYPPGPPPGSPPPPPPG